MSISVIVVINDIINIKLLFRLLLFSFCFVILVNILLNRSVYPECLGGDANAESVLDAVQQLTIPSKRKKMIDTLKFGILYLVNLIHKVVKLVKIIQNYLVKI